MLLIVGDNKETVRAQDAIMNDHQTAKEL